MKRSTILLLSLFLIACFSCSNNTKTEFWSNGNKKSRFSLKEGKMEGPATWWYENGNRQLECNYADSVLNGPFTRYFQNGRKQEETNYVSGKKEGNSLTWFADGKPESSISFFKGIENGPYRLYYPNQVIKVQGQYVMGLMTGKWLYYDHDGIIIGEGNFRHGDGLLRHFYYDGKIQAEAGFRNNQKDGVETEFDENGNITSKKTYVNGDVNNDKNK